MNFEIKNIESYLPPDKLETASDLIQNDLVQSIKSLEKNLWTAQVSESFEAFQKNEFFETEIQLKGKKVKAFTCECDFFQSHKKEKNNICKHIVASLFGLRKHLLKKELENQKAKVSTPGVHKKLTTISVLNSVNPEALKNFVRSYARTDKKFAIALKARFAYAVQVENEKDKYLQLLSSTFNSVKTPKDKINYHAISQIKSVVLDILEQVEDTIALEHFAEASLMLEALIIKIAPNIKRAERHEEKMINLLSKSIDRLKKLITLDIPQELKKDIWKFCLLQTDSREHKKYQTQHHFFELLLELTETNDAADIFIKKIDEQLQFVFEKKKKGELLLIKMKLLEKFENANLNDFILENLNESEVLLAAIQNAIKSENFIDAKRLSLQGLENQKSVIVRNEIENALLSISLKTQQTRDIVIYSRRRFLVTYQVDYFNTLKENYSGEWNAEVDNLLSSIKKQPYTPNKKETIANLLGTENRNLELLNYIKKIRSLDLLQKYDTQLMDDFRKEVFVLYEDFLESYLRNHLGRQTSVKIKEIFYHLKKIGAGKLVGKLTRQYREQYPERHTLIEELGNF